jgi:hypothetical protein
MSNGGVGKPWLLTTGDGAAGRDCGIGADCSTADVPTTGAVVLSAAVDGFLGEAVGV